MLAMADARGRVWASVPGLANRARVPIEDTETALAVFMSPDKYSRTDVAEGRRIEKIDGGWVLINYLKYRAIQDAEARLEYKRAWDRDNRNPTKSDKTGQIRQKPTQEEEELEEEKESSKTQVRATRLPADWVMPAKYGNWALEEKPEWTNDKVLEVAADFKDYWTAKKDVRGSATKLDWFATWRMWIRKQK